MKHASASTLQSLKPLLDALRGFGTLVERRPGIFYLRSDAFLHFHEDPAGLFADVKLDRIHFERLAVVTAADQAELLRRVGGAVEAAAVSRQKV